MTGIDPARSNLRQKRSEQQKILLAHEQNFIFLGQQPVEPDGGLHAAKSPAEHDHPPRHISPQYLDDAPGSSVIPSSGEIYRDDQAILDKGLDKVAGPSGTSENR
jgi:hypothetical protein